MTAALMRYRHLSLGERMRVVRGGLRMLKMRRSDKAALEKLRVAQLMAGLRPGAKVASVGWGGADGAEVDASTMSHVIVVDSREGTLAESGNIRRFNAKIHAELGEVLDGTRPVDPEATVVFDSIGMACEDIAAATLVYNLLAS